MADYVLTNVHQRKLLKSLGTPMESYKKSKESKPTLKQKAKGRAKFTTAKKGKPKKKLSQHMKSMYSASQLKSMGY